MGDTRFAGVVVSPPPRHGSGEGSERARFSSTSSRGGLSAAGLRVPWAPVPASPPPPPLYERPRNLGKLPRCPSRSETRVKWGGGHVPGGEWGRLVVSGAGLRLFGVAAFVVPRPLCVSPKNFLWVLCLPKGRVLGGGPSLKPNGTDARYRSCLFPALQEVRALNFCLLPPLFFESKCAIVGSG